jgi:hypothetical protein
MTNSYKKEYPLAGFPGFGGGAGALYYKSASSKTYIDDVFSTYLYAGNDTSRSITNNIDLSTKGGMVWSKKRTAPAENHETFDTVRGAGNFVRPDATDANTSDTNRLSAFNSDGFSLGTAAQVNASGEDYASWTFAKQEGFFDVVTYTGNGTAGRTVSHSLGCEPGMIIIKNLDSTEDWRVYHRSLGGTHNLVLNTMDAAAATSSVFNQTDPTASVFTVGTSDATNKNGDEFVAYVFAGGASTAATARGVRFDGSDDYLSLGASSDFDMGTGDFTIECWLNRDDTSNNSAWTLGSYDNGMELYCYSDDSLRVYGDNGGTASWLIQSVPNVISPGVWHHVAVVRDSGTLKLFQNGILLGSTAHSSAMPNNGETTDFFIGVEINSSNSIPGTNPYFDGEISNFRVVKGTAVYTTSFIPPYEPLTNITNTKLLCCNNSSVTGSTVTPGTITAHSSPTASTDSPFDDVEGFKFGDDEDKNLNKCGSYIGNGSATGPDVYVGFEPQFIILKQSSASGNQWRMYDSMRNIKFAGNDAELYPSSNGEEDPDNEFLELTSTGFKLKTTDTAVNGNGATYIYFCIRRPDAFVGKPAAAGTDVFAMDTGAGNSVVPNFDSNFPVDYWLMRKPAASQNWYTGLRISSPEGYANTDGGWIAQVGRDTDSNVGWGNNSWMNSDYQSWMWKRGQGMDVVTYIGDDVTGRNIRHNLNAVPEMIWVKCASATEPWAVYHYGANGGTTPWNYYGRLNTSGSFSSSPNMWNQTAPTSTVFTVIADNMVNGSPKTYVAMLFTSVTGISKVGYYTGSGSSNTQTITTGFQPRFVLIKDYTGGSNPWYVMDTTRGWASGNDDILQLNDSAAAITGNDWGAPTATGFTVTGNGINLDSSSNKYIYYAHA